MYESRSLQMVEAALKKSLYRKLMGVVAFILPILIGVLMFWIGGSSLTSVLGFFGYLISALSGASLFLYAFIVFADKFSAGFSKTEKLKWFLSRMCKQLEQYINLKDRGSRRNTRKYLYATARLFDDWSWDKTDKQSIIKNDMFQGDYLEFSFSLRDVFWRLNYLLVKWMDIPEIFLNELRNFVDRLDGYSPSPHRHHTRMVDFMRSSLVGREKLGVDKEFQFAFMRDSAKRKMKDTLSLKFAVCTGLFSILVLGISAGVGVLIPQILPGIDPGSLLIAWTMLVGFAVGIVMTVWKSEFLS